ncbi:MAG: DUF192 domain-containing protein [Myxococcota bacterium]
MSRFFLPLGCLAVFACSASPSPEPAKPAEEPTKLEEPTAEAVDEADTDSAEALVAPPDAVDETPTVTFFTDSGEVVVAVEIADTRALRTKGMMFRETVEPDRGMVFVFGEDGVHPFWMKNTYVSLDMIHLSAGLEVVGVVARAAPLTLDRRAIDKPSRYVVEVEAGYAEAKGIAPGTRASFANVPTEPKD